MRTVLAAIAFVVLMSWSQIATAQCTDPNVLRIPDGFPVTAGQLASLDDVSLAAYVLGFANGTLFSVVAGADVECIEQLTLCIGNKTTAQIVTDLRRYILDRPASLLDDATRVSFNAIFGKCFSEFLDVPNAGS